MLIALFLLQMYCTFSNFLLLENNYLNLYCDLHSKKKIRNNALMFTNDLTSRTIKTTTNVSDIKHIFYF